MRAYIEQYIQESGWPAKQPGITVPAIDTKSGLNVNAFVEADAAR